jgi:tRNA(Ile)-lysidine synthase
MNLKVDVEPGKYILAVSGGVDSMVLLDLLVKQAKSQKPKAKSLELIVAHFNHGIRLEADEDEKFVELSAKRLGLVFEVGYGNLGINASEETARNARYKFLTQVRKKYRAEGIVTAHHQDDLIETAVINVIRGTGRRGLTAIADNTSVVRPLLKTNKAEIINYAKTNNIEWREDETNQDEKYLRNLIRKNLNNTLTTQKREELINNYDKVAEINIELNDTIATISRQMIHKDKIKRLEYILLPHDVGKEVFMWWLKSLGINQFDKKQIEKLDMALRTAKNLSKHPITKGDWLYIKTDSARIATSY